MSTVAEVLAKTPVPDFPPDELLISEDGVALESDWHRIEIGLLVELCAQAFAGREDYFAGGNMFIYFNEEHIRNRDFRGPDFFFVWGASPMPLRPYWAIWKEGGRYPDVIIELLSPTTADMDRTLKKDIYEKTFRTPEYFCYDPDTKTLEGWSLGNGKYEALKPNEKGWLWSNELQLWIGAWDGFYLDRDGTWLRFYTKHGELTPTARESARGRVAAAEQKATAAEQKATAAEQKATAAEQKAAAAQEQADEQRRRAEALEAEVARLQERQEQPPKQGGH